MKLNIILKLSESDMLNLKKGDTFYHVNPFGCKAGTIPTVEEHTLQSDWYSYNPTFKNSSLKGLKRVKVNTSFSDFSYETEEFLSDLVREYKGSFLNKDDAEKYAEFCSNDYETENEVMGHHNRVTDILRGFY